MVSQGGSSSARGDPFPAERLQHVHDPHNVRASRLGRPHMDDLLHSVVAMLGSFRDLLALAATCTSWRAAFSSYSSKSTLLPPLLLQPGVPISSPCPHPLSNSLIPKQPCHCTDLANQDMYMSCQVPLVNDAESFCFIGASCGHIFLARKQTCLVVDIFTRVSVPPPQVPNEGYTQPYYAALTAPLASPDSHLLVITVRQSFFWRVGSQSWLRCSNIGTPKQVVVFKGQVFVMNSDRTVLLVHFVPEIYLQEIAIDWVGEGMTGTYEWLVACDDMLLMVSLQCSLSLGDTFKAFRLDLSTKPAKWVEVERLENWAIFISIDVRIRPLCCINPDRWGGRSNCVYYCSHNSEGWVAVELGKPLQRDASNRSICIWSSMRIEPMWLVPSIFHL
uniref:KIB1-4 beta-propeller domain-containing protein n=1 Tax=Aegilops tauschii TaxID=37682 RepID=N1R3T4_AEGTA